MEVKHFFDPDTFTLTYIVFDSKTKDAIVIDPVWDYDPASGKLTDTSAKTVVEFIQREGLNPIASLDTHAHADHISGSYLLKKFFPKIQIGIGEKIQIIQETFKETLRIPYLKTDGSQFDFLIKDFEELNFGSLHCKAIPTPGHTPACLSYYFTGMVFTGDALFMPDYGTGRCDFPKGNAKDLYHSIKDNLFTLPGETKVFVGHDYMPNQRELQFETTIADSKKANIQLSEKTDEQSYLEFREKRDKTLATPRLLFPSIQINIDAGKLPPAEDNGRHYFKLPLTVDEGK